MNKKALSSALLVMVLLVSAATVVLSVQRTVDTRKSSAQTEEIKMAASPKVSEAEAKRERIRQECFEENPNNMVPGRILFRVKAGTTDAQLISIAKTYFKSDYLQPVEGSTVMADRTDFERGYTAVVDIGNERQTLSNLTQVLEIVSAEQLKASCENI